MHTPPHPPHDASSGGQSGSALAAALMPVLLHKLSNATQLLSGLNTLLATRGGAQLALARAEDMARASSRIEDLGWILAVIASASDADLVLERRERRGLALFVGVLQEALRRQRRELRVEPEELPDLAPGVLSGWELPWGLCSLVLASASAGGETLVLRCEASVAGGRARFLLRGGGEPDAAARAWLARLPGAELETLAGGWELSLPPTWLSADEPGSGER